MPLNGSGTASPPAGTSDFAPNTTIESAKLDALRDDIYLILNTERPIAYGGTEAATAIGAIDNLLTTSSTIASATTTDLSGATGINVTITGTTTITGLGTVQAGALRFVTFGGALTLTHNATSLILPTGANIATAANDEAVFRSLGSGNWKCVSYQRADGSPINLLDEDDMASDSATGVPSQQSTKAYVDSKNHVVQIQSTVTNSVVTTTNTITFDNTIPQNTEGVEVMTRTITPTSSTSLLRVDVVACYSHTANTYLVAALFQDSGADAIASMMSSNGTANAPDSVHLSYVMTAGTTSEINFKVRLAPTSSGTMTFNGAGGSGRFGNLVSSIIVTEITQ